MNLTDYLAEEDQKNLTKSVELSKSHTCKDDLKEMLDVQSGLELVLLYYWDHYFGIWKEMLILIYLRI